MGYISDIRNFSHFEFAVAPNTTVKSILKGIDILGQDYSDELEYWFDLHVDEDGNFTMEPVGESGKAYQLTDVLNALIKVLEPLQESFKGLDGFRLRFELWGEEGEAALYTSDGKQLFRTAGVMTFPGDRIPV